MQEVTYPNALGRTTCPDGRDFGIGVLDSSYREGASVLRPIAGGLRRGYGH
jgi:hypothetical protein